MKSVVICIYRRSDDPSDNVRFLIFWKTFLDSFLLRGLSTPHSFKKNIYILLFSKKNLQATYTADDVRCNRWFRSPNDSYWGFYFDRKSKSPIDLFLSTRREDEESSTSLFIFISTLLPWYLTDSRYLLVLVYFDCIPGVNFFFLFIIFPRILLIQ